MNYHYEKDNTLGECHPDQIDYNEMYSGGTKEGNIYKVIFHYSSYPTENRRTQYFLKDSKKYLVMNTKRLDAIAVEYSEDTNPLKKYNLVYENDQSLTADVFLKSVQLESRGPNTATKIINSTEFNWKFYNPNYTVRDLIDEPTPFPIGAQGLVKIIPIDINGDGIDEIAEFKATLDEEDWHYNIHIQFVNQEIVFATEIIKGFHAADFNNDGLDELLISYGDGFLIYSFEKTSGGWAIAPNVYSNFQVTGPKLEIIPADVTGDGLIDCVISNEDEVKLFIGSGSTSDIFINDSYGDVVPKIEYNKDYRTIAVKDFTGDGQEDILAKYTPVFNPGYPDYDPYPDIKLKLYIYDEHQNSIERINTFEESGYNVKGALYYEDFNGDGKTDFLKISNEGKNGNNHYFFPSFGKGFVKTPQTTTSTGLGFDFPIAVDINNDGRVDLVTINEVADNNVRIKACITKQDGYHFNFQNLGEFELLSPSFDNMDILAITFADLKGNGVNCPIFELYHNPGKEIDRPIEPDELYLVGLIDNANYASDLIQTITNGFGVTTAISYSPFKTSFNSNADYTYPLSRLKAKMPLVSEQATIYYKGKINRVAFSFSDPVYHKKGKGFLGFQQTTVLNYQNNTATRTKTRIYGRWHRKYYHPYPQSIEQFEIKNDNSLIRIDKADDLLFLTENRMEIKRTQEDNPLIYFPVVITSITNRWDLNKSDVGTSKTMVDINDVDIYGNVQKSTSLASSSILSVQQPESSYSHKTITESRFEEMDHSNWFMSRPTYVKTSKFYNGDSNNEDIIEKTFSYYDISNAGWPRLHYIETTPNRNRDYLIKMEYEYDKYGNIITKTIGAKGKRRVTNYEYSEEFLGSFLTKKSKSNDGIDYVVAYDYYKKYGLLKSETKNPEHENISAITNYYYDAFWKVRLVEYPDGFLTKTSFNYWGKKNNHPKGGDDDLFVKETYTYKDGNEYNEAYWLSRSLTYYNKFEQETSGFSWDQNGNIITSRKHYNNLGWLDNAEESHFITSMEFNLTNYQYDKLGRVISVYTPTAILETEYNGLNKTVTNQSTGVWKTTSLNAIGLANTIEDPTGLISYEYYSSGNVKNIDAAGVVTSMLYDDANRQLELQDPNAGTIHYQYNSFGELISQTDANDNNIFMNYDNLGRLEIKTLFTKEIPETINYRYQDDPTVFGFGQLLSLQNDNDINYSYVYDNLGRVIEEKESIEGVVYIHKYTYDDNTQQIESLEYPSGFTILYNYKNNGHLNKITDISGNMLWKPINNNGRGQLTDFSLGNGLSTHKGFDEFGLPSEIFTEEYTQELSYSFESTTGNLLWRKDIRKGYELFEEFDYDTDALNSRLTNWQVRGQQEYSIQYHNNGNFINKTDVTYRDGTYQYGMNAGEHAVTQLLHYKPEYFKKASEKQKIHYTGFNKVKDIEQIVKTDDGRSRIYKMDFFYGPDNARKQTKLYGNNSLLLTKTFISGNYEIENRANGSERKLHYLMGGDGLFAIYVENSTCEDSIYYIHKDYIGNIETITDSRGHTIEKLSFDPWGRKRNATNWTHTESPYKSIFSRGYTTHEHLDVFGIINMNGRLYDPWLGRMLSPDPYVQSPSSLQNYNRYSYAFNNPLKYTDPNGEFANFIFGALMGAYLNVYMNADNINNFGDMFMYAGIGAVAGAVTMGIGVAVAGGIEVSGFIAGAAIGGAGGATNGLITGFGNTFVQGGNIGDAFMNGIQQGAMQGATGALFGGIVGGISSKNQGGNFWSGSKTIKKTVTQTVDFGSYGPGNPGMGYEDPIAWTVTTEDVEIIGISYTDKHLFRGLSNATTYVSEMILGASDFVTNYLDMREAGWIDADKYFHAKANFQATHRGNGGKFAAEKISNFREIWDQTIKGDPLSASLSDQAANIYGRNQADFYGADQFQEALNTLRPRGGFPTKY